MAEMEGMEGAAPEKSMEGGQDEQVSALVQNVGQGLETLVDALGQDSRLPDQLKAAAAQLLDQYMQLTQAIAQVTSGEEGAPQPQQGGTGTVSPEAGAQRVARPM